MGGFFNSGINASIRGYILRSIVKGYHFSLSTKTLTNKMMSCGLITTPDISDQLYYLEQCNLIQFSNNSDAFSALDDDAVIRLTAEGIRFIPCGFCKRNRHDNIIKCLCVCYFYFVHSSPFLCLLFICPIKHFLFKLISKFLLPV